MQAMAVAFGGQVTRGPRPVHGEVHTIHHHGLGAFRFVESPLQATRYHSLAVVEESVPETLDITARTAEGEIMGLSHRTRPVHGVQFHPESIGTQHGAAMLRACLSEALI
jgi:anthranilate synthase/aminodeoxychorismate synthase-like glutamine amidotransferase